MTLEQLTQKYVVGCKEVGLDLQEVVLFGSLAAGEQRPKDVDILLVCGDSFHMLEEVAPRFHPTDLIEYFEGLDYPVRVDLMFTTPNLYHGGGMVMVAAPTEEAGDGRGCLEVFMSSTLWKKG